MRKILNWFTHDEPTDIRNFVMGQTNERKKSLAWGKIFIIASIIFILTYIHLLYLIIK